MGISSSSRNDLSLLSDDDVNFDHFHVVRAIGRGSFGKVCIVQKRDTGHRFAMKYVSRAACDSRDALAGVLQEVQLLSSLEHPFLVNLWFSFQDEEDLFLVSDLLTGGDLRYHLSQKVKFSEESVYLLMCELGSALDYLQKQRVLHRDIKPDNILFDEMGHAHLTDFNIATRLKRDGMAYSMSGTKPYMAPEVFLCALDEITGYSYAVDWWSLGVVAYEMREGVRPFLVQSSTALDTVKSILSVSPNYPREWSHGFKRVLQKLLCFHPGARISTLRELQKTKPFRATNFKEILLKNTTPAFKPRENHLNFDPALELDEMIVESKPLHKKKKRLAKQRSAQKEQNPDGTPLKDTLIKEFLIYNRCKELKKRSMEQKEAEWQAELNELMANSEVNAIATRIETTTLAKRGSGGGANLLGTIDESSLPNNNSIDADAMNGALRATAPGCASSASDDAHCSQITASVTAIVTASATLLSTSASSCDSTTSSSGVRVQQPSSTEPRPAPVAII